jgi:hypothetical protein
MSAVSDDGMGGIYDDLGFKQEEMAIGELGGWWWWDLGGGGQGWVKVGSRLQTKLNPIYLSINLQL